ncbi:MAG: alpha/beta fold hydrolase [Planctomycetaceae bacterium]|nr:alpha/beta fold hydrolase [Planctomycetaceae bacterium]
MLRHLWICSLSLLVSPSLFAADPSFHRHDINLDSTFPAAAAIDVNEDGRLDIVSGGWWYEAPSWQKHFLRNVQEIRGRYDDYSNLPLHVNGDGRLDFISANYRSESIFWIENAGPDVDEWPTHKIETPGHMETGRLYDIDGDGRLDLLPAGKEFAAWWSIVPGPPAAQGIQSATWNRHDLPIQLAGHGIGFGDVDGDGLGDVIGDKGWAKAPLDRSSGQWEWQPEFVLPRDASIPILVHDVDSDGDADLILGRGHRTGLYWLEQQTNDGERDWQMHAIDTEWSQLHSILLADLDNDGRNELIAGKRYLGHDGKDVGEYDPMVMLAYQFDADSCTWQRTVLDWGSRAGMDLDPKAVDLDADGDLDLLCPTRGGLCLLENLHVNEAELSPTAHTEGTFVDYPDHTDVSVVRDVTGELRAIETPDDAGLRRAHILAGMQQAMGPLPGPEMRVPLDAESELIEETENYQRYRVTFASAPGERVIAWLLMPNDLTDRASAMLCLHQTVPIGKDEPAGLGGKPNLHYAHELANRGYVCLVPDYPSFGEDAFDFEAAADRWQSGSMKAIWNNIRSIDYLETLPEVNPDRIGVIGHSLGGHNALFTAAFDQRLNAVITSCGFTEFHQYYSGDLKGWTSLRYMPHIASEYGNNPDRVPFDFQEVFAAIAPRPVFINAPIEDSNFEIKGVRAVVQSVEPVYARLRSRDFQTIRLETPNVGHDFPPDIREAAYEWLSEVLR